MDFPSLTQVNSLLRSRDVKNFLDLSDQYLKQDSLPASIRKYLEVERAKCLPSQDMSVVNKSTQNIDRNLGFFSNVQSPVIASFIKDEMQLLYILRRLTFYVLPFAKNVYICANNGLTLPVNISKDLDYDPSIENEYKKYKNKLHVLNCSFDQFSLNFISKNIDLTDNMAIGFAFDSKSINFFRSDSVNAKCYDTSSTNRNEGSLYIQAIYDFSVKYNSEYYSKINSQTVDNIQLLRESVQDDIAIVCNGPSVRNIATHYCSNYKQTAVTCNTTFMNEELHEYFNFKVIAFADPIFHFGISAYAAQFRANLKKYLSTNDIFVCIPQKYLHIFSYHFGTPKNLRLCVLKPSKSKDINIDLMSSTSVKVTGNILTYLLFPLAALLANKRIVLYGCDGRPSANNEYFWSHDKKSQLSSKKMDNIKKIHPAFFEISYDDYYSEHLALCDAYRKSLDSIGIELYAQTPSYINQFSRSNNYVSKQQEKLQILVSCNPEYGSKQGHFIDYERILNTYCREQGIRHIVFIGSDVNGIDEPEVNANLEKYRAFPNYLSPPQQDSKYGEFAKSCISSISQIAPTLPGNSNIIVFFYLSSFRFLEELISNIESIKSCLLPKQKLIFNINGFWDAHMMPDKLNANDYKKVLKRLAECGLSQNLQFYYSLDTYAAKSFAQEMLLPEYVQGVREIIDVMPFFPMADYKVWMRDFVLSDKKIISLYENLDQRPFDVYFAGTMQEAKGLSLCLQVASNLLKLKENYKVQFRTSNHELTREHKNAINSLKTCKSITFTDSELDDLPYRSSFLNSRVVALAYSPDFFKYKHSAIIYDAIAAGCILVIQENTWQEYQLNKLDFTNINYFVHNGSAEDFQRSIIQAFKLSLGQSQESIRKCFDMCSPAVAIEHLSTKASQVGQQVLLSDKVNNYIVEEHFCYDLVRELGVEHKLMFDIGCCHGASLGIFLANGFDVIAFEPNPDNYQYLVDKYKSNPSKAKLKLVNAGVGNEQTILPFMISKSSYGRHSLFGCGEGDLKETINVEVLRMDSYCKDNAIAKVAYAKVDVEGFEQEVLEGFGNMLNNISVLQLEFDNTKRFRNLETLIDRIDNKFNRIYISCWRLAEEGYGANHKWESLIKHNHGQSYSDLAESWGNIVAINSSVNSSSLSDTVLCELFNRRLKFR